MLKRLSDRMFYKLLGFLSDIHVPENSGDFALLNRSAVEAINRLPERVRFVRGLRAWIGLAQIGIAYDRPARVSGRSKYSLSALIKLALNGILSFSAKPLSIIFHLGLVSSALSDIRLCFLFDMGRKRRRDVWPIPERGSRIQTSIILLLFLLSGLQLISIGIIGAYVARVFECN